MIASVPALDTLKRTRPEWAPWLGILDAVVREGNSPEWDRDVRGSGRPPLLAGASVPLPARTVRRWFDRLVRLASATGTDTMRSLTAVRVNDVDAIDLFTASIRHDTEPATRVAAAHGADPEALQAVAALLPVPFLLACSRRLAASVPADWSEGYCPTCGSWPAFAEVRGIERNRRFRCARCGGDWHARALVCPFCGMNDHDELATLVPASTATHATIDACNGCRGYVKVFPRLQGCPPVAVLIEDLASVQLDIAAVEQGYARPAGAGYPCVLGCRP